MSRKNQYSKWLMTAAFFLFLFQLGLAHAGEQSPPGTTIYDISVKSIEGKPVSLAEYRGKVVMIVNVASQCGFTPQYEGLQKVFEKNKSKGFVILGFPSNDFGQQEPGKNAEIQEFCKLNYGVKFPLFEKGPVTGEAKQPLYKFLTATAAEKGEVSWNFEKFLVGPDGKVVHRWKSKVTPESPEIQTAIDAQIARAKTK